MCPSIGQPLVIFLARVTNLAWLKTKVHVVAGQGDVRTIHDQALAGLPVSDQVDEVRHLTRDGVRVCEILPREELPEVETFLAHAKPRFIVVLF